MEDAFLIGLVVMDAMWLNIAKEEWMKRSRISDNRMTFMISPHSPLCVTP
jgi:hypothetical protein